MKNCIFPPASGGMELEYANSSGSTIPAGDVVLADQTHGVAHGDIADGETGVVYTAGRYEFAKPTGAGTDLAQGAVIGFNTGTQQTVKGPTAGDLGFGRVAVAAGINDATVVVDVGSCTVPA